MFMDTTDILLELKKVHVAYGRTTVVKDVSFTLPEGDISCLLGPSGCGKSTLLRSIIGFEPVSQGQIILQQKRVSGHDVHLPPEKRQVGMVFQDFALFPHMTIADNIAFGLRHWSKAEQRGRVKRLLKMVDLSHAEHYYPHQLSGGQQQRVALVRAMAPRPQLLLLDEPFSSMDIELREQLASEVRSLLKQETTTAIMVTHDQMEAFAIADVIGVMHEGYLLQWGASYDLYHSPHHQFVAEFIGQGVLLPGKVVNDHKVKTDFGVFSGNIPDFCRTGCAVKVLLRPDDIIYDEHSRLSAKIVEKRFRGAELLYTLRMDSGIQVLCLVPSHHNHHLNERIHIHLDVEHLVVFPDEKRQAQSI